MIYPTECRIPGAGRAGASWIRSSLLVLLIASLFACGDYGGGSSGGNSSPAPVVAGDPQSVQAPGIDREEMVEAFEDNTFEVLRDYCTECHAGDGPGFPDIASPDADVAFDAVMEYQKVNLIAPETSRLVRRLLSDLHYCWDDCGLNSIEMHTSIEAWAEAVDFGGGGTEVLGGLASETRLFSDGIEDVSDERFNGQQIAFWDFKEGSGDIAHDSSGVEPLMDLELTGTRWLSNYGIEIVDGLAAASVESSRKLYDHIAAPEGGTQEYTVEAWVIPANTSQEGPARIISYSKGTGNRNFTLGQTLYTYDFRNRSLAAEINTNGRPALITRDGDADLQATLQHVVITFDQFRGRRIFVNGVFTDDEDEQGPGRLWNWNADYPFVLGNETNLERLWLGKLQLVGIYDVALSQAQITQNFEAGVGKKVLLRFDLSEWLAAGSHIEFVVSEFDDYSYLFCEPTLLSTSPGGLRVRNIRVAVNGITPVSGQAFRTLDTVYTGSEQLLSRQCTLIPKSLGVDLDEFRVEFEILGVFQSLVVEPPVAPLPPNYDVEGPLTTEGLRNFERANATMAEVTGVDPNTPSVRDTFDEIREQLPGGFDLRTFTSSNQIAMAKLALEYCDQLVDSPVLRDAFFDAAPAFPFNSPATTAFANQANRDGLIGSINDRILGETIGSQPDFADLHTELDTLIDELTVACNVSSCGADRTQTVVKALCASVLSSAGVLVH
jgi:hypothetical protein